MSTILSDSYRIPTRVAPTTVDAPACVYSRRPKTAPSATAALVPISSTWHQMAARVLPTAPQVFHSFVSSIDFIVYCTRPLRYVKVNIDAAVRTIVAFRCTGSATGRRTALMERMSQAPAKSVSAKLVSSSAPTTTARPQQRFAMASMIAETARMSATATSLVLRTNSSVIPPDDASSERGNVTEITTAVTDPTRIRPSVTHDLATRKQNSRVKTADASRNLGTATRITTAAMDPTSPRTSAGSGIAQPAGGGVRSGATTVAFLSGCFVTAKTTVVTVTNHA